MDSPATDTYHILGTIIRLLCPSAANNGAFSLCEYRVRAGAGSPMNRHPADDESFYVLSGQIEIVIDGVATTHGPGGFARVPNGSPHRFTNTGTDVATMLSVNAPGALHDRFFRTAGEPLPPGSRDFPISTHPPDIAAIRAAAESCGIEFVGSG